MEYKRKFENWKSQQRFYDRILWINALCQALYKQRNAPVVPFLLIYFSGTCIFTTCGEYADVVELADTPDLGSGGVKPVGVRVPPSAPKTVRRFETTPQIAGLRTPFGELFYFIQSLFCDFVPFVAKKILCFLWRIQITRKRGICGSIFE